MSLRSSFVWSVALLLLCASPSAAQQRFTLDHFRKLVGVSGVQLSPDGRVAVITVTRPNYASDHNDSELYAVDVATGTSHPLTFERRTVAGAKFSPDGRRIGHLRPEGR